MAGTGPVLNQNKTNLLCVHSVSEYSVHGFRIFFKTKLLNSSLAFALLVHQTPWASGRGAILSHISLAVSLL